MTSMPIFKSGYLSRLKRVLIFNNGFKLMIFSGFLFSEKFKKKFVSYEFENFKVVRIRSSLEFSAFDLTNEKKNCS